MSQISFGEWFSEVKNMQRVAEGISLNKTMRENYDPQEWVAAKKELDTTAFPDAKFKTESGARRVNAGESHESGKETHSITTFELKNDIGGFEAVWRLGYCATCKKVITKFGSISNNHDNKTHRRYYVKHGNIYGNDYKDVVEKAPVTPRKQEFAKVLDGLSTLGGDLDGK